MPAAKDRFVLRDFEPAYLSPGRREELPDRLQRAVASLRECRVCPRDCRVDRLADQTGVCHTGRCARVNSAFAHHGEEACLRGTAGSGTIFFARCNLRCVFCQNWDISQTDAGRECRPEEIAEILLDLQRQGCHNINFVTPEHVVPQVIEALAIAIGVSLRIPIVYNTSGYDSLESLRQLDGLVDIYMPDFKLFSPGPCGEYLGASDYGDRARGVIAEMHRQVGDLCFTPDGIACRGLLIRHLVMPGLLDESERIFDFLAHQVSRDMFVNIMAQYRPAYRVGARRHDGGGNRRYAEINRRPSEEEIIQAYAAARRVGLWRFDKQP